MTAVASTYSFNISTLANYFEQGLQACVDALAIAKFGTQWDVIRAEMGKLPTVVTDVNADQTQQQLRLIISELRSSKLVSNNLPLQTELSVIDSIIDTGVARVQTRRDRLWGLWSFIKGLAVAPTGEQIALNIIHTRAATARLQACLTPAQQQALNLEPKTHMHVIDFMSKASYEIKAHTFNISTLLALRAIAYGVLGIMGFKTAVVTATAFYLLREVADKSMAFTNYESWIRLPVAVPVGVPFVPYMSVWAIPGTNFNIPTWKGVKQITHSSYNYLSSWILNSTHWKPNFFEFNNVVILKNGIIPLNEYWAVIKESVT